MRLSDYTDYTLRVLMYCATRRDRLVTIGELADHHGLSKNHLMKVVNDLARQGLIETTRGRGGGLRLLAEPADIRIGAVVRASETDFRLVECFDPATNACPLSPIDALDGATLADVTPGSTVDRRISGHGRPEQPPTAAANGRRTKGQTNRHCRGSVRARHPAVPADRLARGLRARRARSLR
jgi:Rrf2 family transcriptional regulator, nitric oxide-sensitive transcriptional repressor